MFIPLNETRESGWPSVLAIGDTASVFYMLGLLAHHKLNVFIADTGVDGSSPLQFRSGRERGPPDLAAAYYDFFDSGYRVGAGVIRRMDLVVYTACRGYVSGWARQLRIPSVYVKRRPDGTVFEAEGALPDAGSVAGSTPEAATARLLTGMVEGRKRYVHESAIITLDADGHGHLYPPVEKKAVPAVEPEETAHSAWDAVVEVLQPGESMVIDRPDDGSSMKVSAGEAPGPKLIELGVPELHILKIGGPRERYIELTGDAQRVFDGIL
jgi:hypothetical protein